MAKKRYQVQLKPSVEKAYAKLPDKAKKRIAGRLRSLEDDPRTVLVPVLKIADRKDVYRGL